DWVVMKALEKDRTRRYATANAFARDLQRYLADELVEARPATTAYRLRKFVRRNKGRVVAAALVLLALVGGGSGTALGRREARRQEQAAREAAAAKETARAEEAKQRDAAEKRLDQVVRANAILGSLFKDLNPREAEQSGKPLQALLGERLDQATAQIE